MMSMFRACTSIGRGFVTATASRSFFTRTRARTSSGLGTGSGRIVKLSLVSAGVGALVGVGYSGYTHYQLNNNLQSSQDLDNNTPIPTHLLDRLPDNITPTRRIVNDGDDSGLKIVLFQFQTCPYCCKVRAFLDANGLSYDVVEVDAVLRQSIKWSKYKKVPIMLVKTSIGYAQLTDSSTIISILSSYLMDKKQDLYQVAECYPTIVFTDDAGKSTQDILNKYFLMFRDAKTSKTQKELAEERNWRKWADDVLVHMISPNVYRTLDESYETFNWFADIGEWRQNFPSWECSLMIHIGANAMHLISKRLKKKHNLCNDVRVSLYNECNYWLKALSKKGTTFMGGSVPDLSDLAVYGVLSSMEGCAAFKDLSENTKISTWFYAVKNHINANKGISHN